MKQTRTGHELIKNGNEIYLNVFSWMASVYPVVSVLVSFSFKG